IDPGAYVDDAGAQADADDLARRFAALPWDALESTPEDTLRHYAGQTFDLATQRIVPTREAILRAAVIYGGAVAHVAKLARHLASRGVAHDLEISVDETETPTTATAHLLIAGELRRLGVTWVSLAPRFVGRFEKGIDYIGDLTALRRDLLVHAEIAACGPYKLSLHSGSDKFSVYPLIAAA